MAARSVNPLTYPLRLGNAAHSGATSFGPMPCGSGNSGNGLVPAMIAGLVVQIASMASGYAPQTEHCWSGFLRTAKPTLRREQVNQGGSPLKLSNVEHASLDVPQSLGERTKQLQNSLELNITQLAKLLSISRKTLYEWLAETDAANPRYNEGQERLRAMESLAQRLQAADIGRVHAAIHHLDENGNSLYQRVLAGEDVLANLASTIEHIRHSRVPGMRRMSAKPIDEIDY